MTNTRKGTESISILQESRPYKYIYSMDRLALTTRQTAKLNNYHHIFYRAKAGHVRQSHNLIILTKRASVLRFWSIHDLMVWLKRNTNKRYTFYGLRSRCRRSIAHHRNMHLLGYTVDLVRVPKNQPEVWRNVAEVPGYQVSTHGRVRSLPRIIYRGSVKVHRNGRIIRQTLNHHGYLKISLHHNGHIKSINVSKLVAEAFIPNPHHYNETCHLDEQRLNNFSSNLIWCDQNFNIHYGNRTQKTYRAVKLIKGSHIYRFPSMIDAARWMKRHNYSTIGTKELRGFISDMANPNNKYHHIYGFTAKRIKKGE